MVQLTKHEGLSRETVRRRLAEDDLKLRIPLITMPEEGTADSMTWRWTATTDG
jgi:hypothetical protein